MRPGRSVRATAGSGGRTGSVPHSRPPRASATARGFAGNAHTHIPGNWIAAVEYLLELGADINQRDANGYTPLHHAAARGDTEMIQWLVDRGADVMVVSRKGQTTVDMANGPVSRVTPYPEAIALLESMGAINNHNCISC